MDCRDGLAAGWRRPIGCLKLQVIFRKRATNYRALLRKMTYKDKGSYRSSPPCKWTVEMDFLTFRNFCQKCMPNLRSKSHNIYRVISIA